MRELDIVISNGVAMICGNDIVYDMNEYSSTIAQLTSELYKLKEERDNTKSLTVKQHLEYRMITINNLLNGFKREYRREFF